MDIVNGSTTLATLAPVGLALLAGSATAFLPGIPAWIGAGALCLFAGAGLASTLTIRATLKGYQAQIESLLRALPDPSSDLNTVPEKALASLGQTAVPIWVSEVTTAKCHMEVAIAELTARFSEIVGRLNQTVDAPAHNNTNPIETVLH